ncbi:Uncharacterized protein DBV15_00921 [Temnothorax longispinosus]|uniref:Uncharacterized protein n=1 Tax=Temnothorax longispinosus TaxID=300112 RepID=A0A4S2JCK2_9HYME|nr:Uncharacterized protein DBV15_00921 [Temnothorax longispinosus]
MCRLYGSISINSLDKPRRDEIRVGDKVKGGLCVVRSRSKLRQRYQSSRVTESETFTTNDDNEDVDAAVLPCDHLAIAPPTIHHRATIASAKEKSRGDSMVSLIRSARRGSVARSIRPIERALDQDDPRSRPAYARSTR